MSFTAFITLVGTIVMFGAWLLIGQRMKKTPQGVSVQVKLLRNFLLFLGLFFVFMFLPQLTLSFDSSLFPAAMAWGYIIGHVFFYVALANMVRMTFSMIPRLEDKQQYGYWFAIALGLVVTALTVMTMGFGTQPQYDFQNHVTLFNAAPIVGASIAILAALSVVPAAILMILNGVHNPSARTRSYLLGIGLCIIMIAGPIHDTARTAELYLFADVVTLLGFVVLASGILYRFEERLVPVRSTSAPSAS